MPLVLDKCKGPIMCITFLGIELESVVTKLWLPKDKLLHLNETSLLTYKETMQSKARAPIHNGSTPTCCNSWQARRDLHQVHGILAIISIYQQVTGKTHSNNHTGKCSNLDKIMKQQPTIQYAFNHKIVCHTDIETFNSPYPEETQH